jgi:hypothetical protein
MNKSIEIQAPNKMETKEGYISVFLAGSIEMGKAEDWQKDFIDGLKDEPIIFLNPRRDNWDSSWDQTIENEKFKEQVIWELSCLEMADVIVLCFDPNTLSPISMIEFGLHARNGKLIVYCPDGFWKKGNIDVTSEFYKIKQVDSFDSLKNEIKNIIKLK